MKKGDSDSPKKQAQRRKIALGLVVFVALTLAAVARAQTEAANLWITSGPAGGVLSLAMDPHDSATLFAATETGIFKTTNAGQAWNELPSAPTGALSLAIDPGNSQSIFAGGASGVYHSTDAGGHFSLTGLQNRTAALAIDPTNSRTMYAGGAVADLKKSTDGGSTWNGLSTMTLVRSIASLLIDQRHSATVYAGGDWDYSYYYYAPFHGVIKTTDGGTTWRPAFPSIWDGAVKALVADPRSSDVLYAGDGRGFVARTQDGGNTWVARQVFLSTNVSSLAIDPAEPTTIYAGTDLGVFRSIDSGSNWARFGEGLPVLPVSSLAIDPTGEFLHAGTGSGVFDLRVQRVVPVAPCAPGAHNLCLLGGRFLVTLQARDPRTGFFTDGVSVVQGDGFGYFSFPAFTGDKALPEVVVKMLDASASEWRSFWFFFSGLTDVAYAITVIDTITGQFRSYQNDPGSPYCGGADTSAFPADGAGTQTGTAHARAASTLSASGTELSLLSGRFTLALSATDLRTGRTSIGAAIPQNDRFGYFSLPSFTGDANFPEVFVKMVDATSFADDFWLFYTGLTDLDYMLTATDTVTGQTQIYTSPAAYCGAADTAVTRP